MLANQNLLIETMQAGHKHTESLLALLTKACSKLGVPEVGSECEQLRGVLRDTDSMFSTLRAASTADLSQVQSEVKAQALDVIDGRTRELEAGLKKRTEAMESDLADRFKKLESKVLSEVASGGEADEPGKLRMGKAGDNQMLKKVTNRMTDFETQVSSQLQVMSQDIEKKLAFLGSQQRGGAGGEAGAGVELSKHDLDALRYDVGELKDLMSSTKGDASHVKRIVLACERDMEDFTAAMDAVNVDLDEMRARVDSTHSIITSRQRVEATVTAEISTMRLDMGDMQEALKAHDTWMEDVSQSLQEAHERCQQLAEDTNDLRDQTQVKLDGKTDIVAWNDMNDDIDGSIKTVRDMASALRVEVDGRRRKVEEALNQVRGDLKQLDDKVEGHAHTAQRSLEDTNLVLTKRIDERVEHSRSLELITTQHAEVHQEINGKISSNHSDLEIRMGKLEADLRRQDEEMHKAAHDRVDGVERHQANTAKETQKRLNALDLRISGLQGASGESKRDINKLRDEVNSLTVKSAAHDVDIGKSSDDCRKLERQRAEDNQRQKQDMDAVYEELDQKVYEKSFSGLEDNVIKLTRGAVKLCQVVGVFPGARMNDGTEEELDVDVELLNWEDCAQNLTARVEKTWRQMSSQKYRSILDLVSKKADHSVLRLLQISQQHIESQLDRVRHERELWKEVVDKRAQQPLQLALTLKDPHTGQPLAGPGGYAPPGFPVGAAGHGAMAQRISETPPAGMPPMPSMPMGALTGPPPPAGFVGGPADQPGGAMKASPLAKRIARPSGPSTGAPLPPQKA